MSTFYEEYRFGSARWSRLGEIAGAGLNGPKGPFIGYAGQAMRLPGDAPMITFGGAGSGKLRDVLAYNLCGMQDRQGVWHAPRRMLINDPRGELAAISIGNQVRLGKAAYCINPFGLHGLPRHRVNPWNILRKGSPTLHTDIKLLVGDLIPLPARGEQYFVRRARELAEALIRTYIAQAADSKTRDPISLSVFYDLVNMTASPSGWAALVARMMEMPDADIRRIAEEMNTKRYEAPKEFSAILGSIYESVESLSDPVVRDALSGSDFSLEVLCQQDCNIYLVVPAEYLGLLAPVLRAIFGSAILYKNRHPAAPNVMLMVDEAAQLGNFEALLRTYSYGRGMGLRVWSFWQDIGQIARAYGPAALSTFIGSSQFRQFFGVRDYETARLVSNMLGQQTLEYDNVLEQNEAHRQYARVIDALLEGGDPISAGFSLAQFSHASKHRTKQARPLMTPDEVLNMPEDEQILFISGLDLPPIRANKLPYYTRPEMAGGYLPNPYHPPNDRVPVAGRWGSKWVPIVKERVPAHLAHWPQYQSGEWSYVAGYRPV